MFEKLRVFYSLFSAGQAVADPAKWKSHQITSTMLGALILAIAHLCKIYNIDLPIDETTAEVIAGGFIAVVNVVLTIITSKHAGMSQKATEAVPEQETLQPTDDTTEAPV